MYLKRTLTLCLLLITSVFHAENISSFEDKQVNAIYHSLNPKSLSQMLTFYELYPESISGKNALDRALALINKHRAGYEPIKKTTTFPILDIQAIVSLVNPSTSRYVEPLTDEQLVSIEQMTSHLANRQKKGYKAWKKEEVLELAPEDLDLARALLIYEYEGCSQVKLDIRRYEATLDIMALHVLARLEPNATPEQKIRAMNDFIFHEMRFRFPPHSEVAQGIDLYTFLPSVIDKRQGVCLGVSILCLCLAQRIDLPLEIITPPGHIYIRYRTADKEINIETTARGIHIPSESYLSMNTYYLPTHTIKEVVGMAFFNQASVAWHKKDYEMAIKLYEKSLPFMPDSTLVKMFLGYNYFFMGQDEKAKALLQEVVSTPMEGTVYPETAPEDILKGRVDAESVKAAFGYVDEKRESILAKQKELAEVVKKHPLFRDGHLQLAITWMQLGRKKEALNALLEYQKLDPNNPTVNYYLSILSMQRLNYSKAWEFFFSLEKILAKRDYHPKALLELKWELKQVHPQQLDFVSQNS